MHLQSASCSGLLPNLATRSSSSSQNNRKEKNCTLCNLHYPSPIVCQSSVEWRRRRIHFGRVIKRNRVQVSLSENSSKKGISYLPYSNTVATTDKSDSGVGETSVSSVKIYLEPFRGKPGSVSFCGLDYQLIEQQKLASSPFKDDTRSLLWILGPLALISSLVLPQFFISNAIEVVIKDEILTEIVASFCSEAVFYIGLAIFLIVTEHLQRPYLEYSSKQWGLITGLRGYLSSALFTMGFKVFAPLLAAYVVWPAIGLPAVIAVVPYLLGCAAQFVFEVFLDKRDASCWPLLPIIFEVYRLYQLNKAAHFIERLILSMRGSAISPELLERSSALFSMLAVFQILGIVSLWSLATFLLRLFPSRPVAERY